MSPPNLPALLAAKLTDLAPGPLLVAFSGGLDSTVLLHALAGLAAARERGLRALHVDHGLQAQSRQWARHCAQLAAGLQLPLEVVTLGELATRGRGVEQAARAARRDAFAASQREGEIVVLAQHADDQAETVLLKLLRGAGPEGLAGMRALRPFSRGSLWRPLLDLRRAALRDYALAHELAWVEDPSNADTRLRRNFLRADILPRLTGHWPGAAAAIAHSAHWARAAAAFIEQEAHAALAAVRGPDDPTTIAWRAWLDLPDALRDPVLRLWLRSLGLQEPAHFHVAEVERQLRHAGERAAAIRWNATEVRRYRDLLHAMPALAPAPGGWQADWHGAPLDIPGGGRLLLHPVGAALHAPLPPLRVAFRRGGERLRPAGGRHARELRLLLQEAGVPPWQRERLPLIAADGELLAAADVCITAAGRELLDRVGAEFVWQPAGRAPAA